MCVTTGLYLGDADELTTSVSRPPDIGDVDRATCRRRRMHELLREWATTYERPEPTTD